MRFIHFACWNNKSNDIKSNFNNFASFLNKYVTNNKPDFMVVAGDNYYSTSEKKGDLKFKLKNDEELVNGFKSLPQDIKKFFLLGNHELDDLYDSNNLNLNDIDAKCKNLFSQRNYINNNLNSTFIERLGYFTYNNTLIITLDTNLFVDEKDFDSKCYTYINSTPLLTKIQTGGDDNDIAVKNKHIQEHVSQIKNLLNENKQKNIIFIGHHPIIVLRDKQKKPVTVLQEFINFFKQLDLRGRSINYLCGDTHFYQESKLNLDRIEINQYIVGTGGADFDNPYDHKEKTYINDFKEHFELKITGNNKTIEWKTNNYSYTICNEVGNTNGFLEINIDDEPNFKFVSVNDINGIKKKYKIKYY